MRFEQRPPSWPRHPSERLSEGVSTSSLLGESRHVAWLTLFLLFPFMKYGVGKGVSIPCTGGECERDSGIAYPCLTFWAG